MVVVPTHHRATYTRRNREAGSGGGGHSHHLARGPWWRGRRSTPLSSVLQPLQPAELASLQDAPLASQKTAGRAAGTGTGEGVSVASIPEPGEGTDGATEVLGMSSPRHGSALGLSQSSWVRTQICNFHLPVMLKHLHLHSNGTKLLQLNIVLRIQTTFLRFSSSEV